MEWVQDFHNLLRDNHPPGSSCWGADGLHCSNYNSVHAPRCQCCQARWDSPVPPRVNIEYNTAPTGLHQHQSPLPFLWFWLATVLATHLPLMIKFILPPPFPLLLQNLHENSSITMKMETTHSSQICVNLQSHIMSKPKRLSHEMHLSLQNGGLVFKLDKGCTNPGHQVTVLPKFWMTMPNICISAVLTHCMSLFCAYNLE
jgi:hypothetical protein